MSICANCDLLESRMSANWGYCRYRKKTVYRYTEGCPKYKNETNISKPKEDERTDDKPK